eukprot:TRINITY_DN3189_c0_g1_i1.p1 TRINITY_DN3189_c0_g1~~TRINITY_DN3189_c0_g1_i1.p1  ORF type:complete len:474 (+),score=178.09 TRINITY_DN3189_c0_g1_i1:79-1422(+)
MGNEGSKSAKASKHIHAMWKEEAKLNNEERRKRYKCKDNYVAQDSIPDWEKDNENHYKQALDHQLDIAREDERNKINKAEKENRKKQKQAALEGKEVVENKRDQQKAERRKMIEEETKKLREEMLVPLASYTYNEEINKRVSLIRGDITKLEIDAIVNAANSSLLGGGGIDGAIHSAAGKKLVEECELLGGAETGESKITRGYNLPAKYVLHTVGPIGRNQPALIQAYTNSLEVAAKHDVKSIALCGISSGIYGYPLYPATHVAMNTVRKWLEKKENLKKFDLIIFCTFLEKELVCYQNLMPMYFPPKDHTTETVVKQMEESYSKYDSTNDETLSTMIKEDQEKVMERKERKRMVFKKKTKDQDKKEENKEEEKENNENSNEEKREEKTDEEKADEKKDETDQVVDKEGDKEENSNVVTKESPSVQEEEVSSEKQENEEEQATTNDE